MGYKVGDMVVYPRHGAAKVEAITERTVKGITREYLQLSVLSSDGLVINVPVDNAKKVGVRDIVDANEVAKVFEILRTPIIEKEMNWSRRYKLNVEKIATGDVNKIAEVVRDLAQRDVDEHGLSAGEKRMLTKARNILTSEISLSEKLDETEAQRLLDVNLGYEPAQPGDEKHHTEAPEEAATDSDEKNITRGPWRKPLRIRWLESKPKVRSPRRSKAFSCVSVRVLTLIDSHPVMQASHCGLPVCVGMAMVSRVIRMVTSRHMR